MKRLIVSALMAASLAACVDDPNGDGKIYGNTARGAAIGAIGGAALGTLAGGNDARNALIGAGIGALAGGGVGVYMDNQEAELRRNMRDGRIGIIRHGNQIELRMPSDVTFAVNESSIQSGFYPTLNDLARALNDYKQTEIDIVGHTDSDGTKEYNQQLSERRADSVRDYLVSQGVHRARVYTAGRGETQPIAPNDNAADKAKNRRVQIILTPITQG